MAYCSKNKDIPDDIVLGNLLFMSLADMEMTENELCNIFKKTSVPERYIRKISPTDAFRRATSSVKGKRVTINNMTFTQPSNKYVDVKLEVDEVRCDNDMIKRIVGIKSIDDSNDDVEYEPILEIIFNRQNETVNYTMKQISHEVEQIGQEIVDKYTKWAIFHNKDTIRNLINRIVLSTHPVNLMPTGLCKFIPKSNTDLIYHLKDALEEMQPYISSTGGKNICEIIPVIDTDDQRKLIEESMDTEITNDLFDLVKQLRDANMAKQKLSSRTVKSYVTRFNELKKKTEEYEHLLGVYKSTIRGQILNAMQLVDKSKED